MTVFANLAVASVNAAAAVLAAVSVWLRWSAPATNAGNNSVRPRSSNAKPKNAATRRT